MDKNKIVNIFDNIIESLTSHYNRENIDVALLINRDIQDSKKERTDADIYERLVLSIHNANWKVVSFCTFWDNHYSAYRKEFYGFDFEQVALLKEDDLLNKGLINSRRKLNYCISAAKFLVDIKKNCGSIRHFFDKFAFDGSDVYLRWSLASLLSQMIDGIKEPLACDFLKEIGYLNYGKPDVHIKRILDRIGVLEEIEKDIFYKTKENNFLYFRLLDRVSTLLDKSVFEVDKIIWLFGTGFNRTNSESIGGICAINPACDKCLLDKSQLCKKHNLPSTNV